MDKICPISGKLIAGYDARQKQYDADDDEAMEKLFTGPEKDLEEFSVRKLDTYEGSIWQPGNSEATSDSHLGLPVTPQIKEEDYESFHRSGLFPHVPHTLHPHHHHHHHHRHKTRRKRYHGWNEIKKKAEETRTEESTLEISIEMEGWIPVNSKDEDSYGIGLPLPDSRTPKERKRLYTDASVLSTDEEAYESAPLLHPDVARVKSIMRSSETDTGGSEDELNHRKKSGQVKFNIGSDVPESDEDERKKHHRKRRHHHHHHRFHNDSDIEDPIWRSYPGGETVISKWDREALQIVSNEVEELHLQEHHLHTLSSHRFSDATCYRRHRVKAKSSMSSFIHPSDKSAIRVEGGKLPIMKKTLDHNPHEVFVELCELEYNPSSGPEWKETARWIKYEEDVEGADNRWGRPHIAFLNFNALFSLRKGLEKGAVLLDLDEKDLPSIATRVVDHMVTSDQIPYDQRDNVIRILLLRHKHIKEQPNLLRRASRASALHLLGSDGLPGSLSVGGGMDRRGSISRKTLSNIFHTNTFANFARRNSNLGDDSQTNGMKSGRNDSHTQINVEEGYDSGKEKMPSVPSNMNLDLMKKIPEGAEATAVLVGAVDFLKSPTIAFVRLAEGVQMENVIEVPIPVRFIFVLLGPFQGEMDYHEVGRSISTLMSDKAFHEVAYKAHSRGQLLSAINDFLNTSIVLPPADWKDNDLIPIDDIRAKAQEIMRKHQSKRAKRKSTHVIKEAEAAEIATISKAGAAGGSADEGGGKPPPRDPLKRTGKLFHGLIEDIKGRYPAYLSDIKDGLNVQVLSTIIFIFFASLSPSITFGGIYSDQTLRLIGVGETLLATCINGIIFALFAAQPLLIVGATGPLMIFDMSLLAFAVSSDLDYLSIRVWVGIWMVVIGLIVTAFELAFVVKKFTRFTEEIYSFLVCLIFIYGAFENLGAIFSAHPLVSQASSCFSNINETEIVDGTLINGTLFNATTADGVEVPEENVLKNQPNTALLSMTLMLGTFIIAFKLKKFRNSKYLGRTVRRALGDFGVPISIIVMVAIDFFIRETYTDKLSMPEGLEPSNAEARNWIINPLGVTKPLPVWCMIVAAPAALLLFILIFIETNICHLILKKPERCLKKGTGFHLDILLSCLINTVSGFIGAPFMSPACVRTIAHMSSLTVMSTNVPPGESPKIVGCLEQRVSSFCVALFVGLGVMLYFILNMVPTSVLLGVFLYMGVSATAGIQLFDRIILFFMPVKYHPNVAYVKKVKTWKMNMFTGMQVFMLAVLWGVKQSPAALAVPFVLMLLIPMRIFLMPVLFSSVELQALDGTEQSSLMDSPDDEPDFFETVHDLPPMEDESHNHQS